MPDQSALVLIVENDETIREQWAEYIGKSSFIVEQAVDLESAVRIARQLHPEVILFDMYLGIPAHPIEDLTAMRAASPSSAVVAVSGDVTLHDEALRAGALEFIPKPVSRLSLLTDCLSAMCKKRLSDQSKRILQTNGA